MQAAGKDTGRGQGGGECCSLLDRTVQEGSRRGGIAQRPEGQVDMSQENPGAGGRAEGPAGL